MTVHIRRSPRCNQSPGLNPIFSPFSCLPAKEEGLLGVRGCPSSGSNPMFLASVLKASEGAKYIVTALGNGGQYCSFADRGDDTDLMVARLLGFRIKQKYSRVTVRCWLRKNFYSFRRDLTSRENGRLRYAIGGITVRQGPATKGWRSLWSFGAGLARPFGRDGDPFLGNLHAEALFPWMEGNPPELGQGQLYCPYDGPVLPVMATISGGSLQVDDTAWLCPSCLGTFQ